MAYKETALFSQSEADGEVVFVNSIKPCPRTRMRSVALAFISVLTVASSGLPLAGSYLVDPVSRSCQGWGQSATIIGEATLIGTIGVSSAAFGPLVRHFRIRTLVLFAILSQTIGFGISAATVAKCEESVAFTRIVYIASFALIGLSNVLCFFANFEFMIDLFPRHIGLVSCLITTAFSVSGLAWSQYFLAMDKYTEKRQITLPTVLLLSGVFTVMIMSPELCLSRSRPPNQSAVLPEEGEKRTGNCVVIRSGRYWFLFILRVVALVPGFGLLSRQKTFLKTLWPVDSPMVALAVVSQFCYTVGRLFTILAECFSATTLLVLDFAVGAICLGFLPALIGNGVGGIITYGLYSFMFGMHKPLVSPMASEMFGSNLATEGTGLLGLAYGVGGLVGPLAMEAMYHSEGGFKSFLYLSCGLAFLGYLGLILVLYFFKKAQGS